MLRINSTPKISPNLTLKQFQRIIMPLSKKMVKNRKIWLLMMWLKKYGYKFTVDLIFPAENAKEIKEQFKEWLNSHGVRFEPKSKSVKVEIE